MTKTIEEWYQFSKVFGFKRPKTAGCWSEVKRLSRLMKPVACFIHDAAYDIRFLIPWYKLLWLVYLDKNPDLVEYASQFDEFNDVKKGSSRICQADVIKQYIKEGRKSVLEDCDELIQILGGDFKC